MIGIISVMCFCSSDRTASRYDPEAPSRKCSARGHCSCAGSFRRHESVARRASSSDKGAGRAGPTAFVDVRVMGYVPGPILPLVFSRHLAVQQQVANLEIAAVDGQVFNRNAPIFKDAFVTIDVGYAALA